MQQKVVPIQQKDSSYTTEGSSIQQKDSSYTTEGSSYTTNISK